MWLGGGLSPFGMKCAFGRGMPDRERSEELDG